MSTSQKFFSEHLELPLARPSHGVAVEPASISSLCNIALQTLSTPVFAQGAHSAPAPHPASKSPRLAASPAF